jgi:hypothetical protein
MTLHVFAARAKGAFRYKKGYISNNKELGSSSSYSLLVPVAFPYKKGHISNNKELGSGSYSPLVHGPVVDSRYARKYADGHRPPARGGSNDLPAGCCSVKSRFYNATPTPRCGH